LKPVQGPVYLLCSDGHPRLQHRPQPSSSLGCELALPRAKARERQYRKRRRNCEWYIFRCPGLCLSYRWISKVDTISLSLLLSSHQTTCPGKAGASLLWLWRFPHHLYRLNEHVSGTSTLCGCPLEPPANPSTTAIPVAWSNDLPTEVTNTHRVGREPGALRVAQGGWRLTCGVELLLYPLCAELLTEISTKASLT